MSEDRVDQPVRLPVAEAADLAVRAAEQGVSTPDYLGYHVLKSAYGALHPAVVAFERRPKLGQTGTEQGE
ncbi:MULTISPECIES: hypothetical protein [Burkholderia cepacia complex]|uniref:hypothetical protein n=1 Tax=Burkholderia territorii TaxID=1503055 RepID=UPI0007543A37|nr:MULTISPECIES: hypothetical protein [Burkholderia cepacia complex]KWE25697.1 hypothetical protein WT49_02240 [Burkholderia territorii]KWE39196.1 hypothetical protein WT50_18295 [Burkholderia territorii]KWE52788.1 hypothetical protein WT51_08600 [Burkholderia territorii]CAG9259569.1 conserved hypothetical protein [Burkholderia diffusa]